MCFDLARLSFCLGLGWRFASRSFGMRGSAPSIGTSCHLVALSLLLVSPFLAVPRRLTAEAEVERLQSQRQRQAERAKERDRQRQPGTCRCRALPYSTLFKSEVHLVGGSATTFAEFRSLFRHSRRASVLLPLTCCFQTRPLTASLLYSNLYSRGHAGPSPCKPMRQPERSCGF